MKYEKVGREHCFYGLTKDDIAFMDITGYFSEGRPSISIFVDDPIAIDNLRLEGATLTPKIVDTVTGQERMKVKLNLFNGEKVNDKGEIWPAMILKHTDGQAEFIHPEGRGVFNDQRRADNIAEFSVVFHIRESLKYHCMTCTIDEFCMTTADDNAQIVPGGANTKNILGRYYGYESMF